jgi:hypothetical protein
VDGFKRFNARTYQRFFFQRSHDQVKYSHAKT